MIGQWVWAKEVYWKVNKLLKFLKSSPPEFNTTSTCANCFNQLLNHRPASTELATGSNAADYLKTNHLLCPCFLPLQRTVLLYKTWNHPATQTNANCPLLDKWFWLETQGLPSLSSIKAFTISTRTEIASFLLVPKRLLSYTLTEKITSSLFY